MLYKCDFLCTVPQRLRRRPFFAIRIESPLMVAPLARLTANTRSLATTLTTALPTESKACANASNSVSSSGWANGSLIQRRGTRSVLGFTYTPNLAAAVISAAIREEGAAEVTGLRDVLATLDGETRGFFYDVTVDTIYGAMRLTGTAV